MLHKKAKKHARLLWLKVGRIRVRDQAISMRYIATSLLSTRILRNVKAPGLSSDTKQDTKRKPFCCLDKPSSGLYS